MTNMYNIQKNMIHKHPHAFLYLKTLKIWKELKYDILKQAYPQGVGPFWDSASIEICFVYNTCLICHERPLSRIRLAGRRSIAAVNMFGPGAVATATPFSSGIA